LSSQEKGVASFCHHFFLLLQNFSIFKDTHSKNCLMGTYVCMAFVGREGLDLNKFPNDMWLGGDDANGQQGDALSCKKVQNCRGYTRVDGTGESSTLANQVHDNAITKASGANNYVAVPTDATISPVSAPKGHGHRKVPRPIFETQWKRCTRNNKEGYIFEALPDRKKRRKTSSVPKDKPPTMIPVTEVQHIRLEECHNVTKQLTEEHLDQHPKN
jgi:hypothetical protein